MLIFTEAFSKQPFQRIPLYRGWNLLSCQRKSEAGAFTALFSDQDRNARVATAKIVLKNLLKIDRSR
jgi:hypothetical protein